MVPLLTYYSKNNTLTDEELEIGCRICSKQKCPVMVYFADVDGPFEPSLKHVIIREGDSIADVKERLKSGYGTW